MRILLDTHAFIWWLAGPHRDPFDRMLIAQALLRDLMLLSNEEAFDRYGVNRLW